MKNRLCKAISGFPIVLKFILILILISSVSISRLNAQNELDVIKNNWLQYSDAPNSLFHHLAGQAFNLLSEVYGFAKKEMGPVMLHAAAFDQSITRIALIEPYSSYQSIAVNHFYDSKFVASIVPGALTAYDLPDLAASLAPKKLLMADVTDGKGKRLDQESIRKEFEIIQTAYKNLNMDTQIIVVSLKPDEKLYDYLNKWMK